MRRILVLWLCVSLLFGAFARAEMIVYTDDGEDEIILIDEEAPQPVEITLTAAGDVTFGGNMKGNPASTIYTRALEAKEGDLSYLFANVRDIFAADDVTLVNFEGVLTHSTTPGDGKHGNDFLFRAPPEHADALVYGAIEAVTLENNHTMDFGEKGLADTIEALESRGIVYTLEGRLGMYETKGVTIGLLGYQTFNDAYARLAEQVPLDIAEAKKQCEIVVVSFHWGNEKDYAPHERQQSLGRAAVDAGADLVLGHHSHRVNPIERYNGAYIVYSLANCSFSGNAQPSDMDTFLFQTKFIVSDGAAVSGPFRVIPCSISSVTGASGRRSGENDFAITPFAEGSEAAQRVLDRLMKEGKALKYAVESYPTQWGGN